MNASLKTTHARLLIALSIVMSALMMTGCASSTVTPSVIQQSLLVKCPMTLPTIQGKTGSDVVLLARQWSSQYHECATIHNGLVDAIQQSR